MGLIFSEGSPMNLGKLLKTIGLFILNEAKKRPKTTATIVATVIGGTVGTKIKSQLDNIPDDLVR
jgi:hypothetical protein